MVVGLAVEFLGSFKASQLARHKIADLTQKAQASFDKAKSAEDDAGKSIVLLISTTTQARLRAFEVYEGDSFVP